MKSKNNKIKIDHQLINDYYNLMKNKCNKNNPLDGVINDVPSRIVAIGDIHGDFFYLIQELKLAKLINDKNKWIGKDAILVSVGDLIDRCRKIPCVKSTNDENSDIKILKFFTKLHNEAITYGGAVYSLIGNHELMNVSGDFRYVSGANIDNFEKHSENQEFLINLPEGLANEDARKWSFQPGNPLAEFLACTRLGILKIGPFLFSHAGVIPQLAEKYNISDINKILSLYLFNKLDKNHFDQYNLHELLGPSIKVDGLKLNNEQIINSSKTSFVWTRIFGNLEHASNEICKEVFNPVKELWKIGVMFIGHTPKFDGIQSVCTNKNGDGIIYLDHGVSRGFDAVDINNRSKGRNPQVVEIINKKLYKKSNKTYEHCNIKIIYENEFFIIRVLKKKQQI